MFDVSKLKKLTKKALLEIIGDLNTRLQAADAKNERIMAIIEDMPRHSCLGASALPREMQYRESCPCSPCRAFFYLQEIAQEGDPSSE